MNTIETHPTGTFFDFADPVPEDVHVEDIARSLSMLCRFGGHVSRFYSVAEHACLVARLVREAGHSTELEFAALHHDSAEAYLGDVCRPLKLEMGGSYDYFTSLVDEAIELRFDGLSTEACGDPVIKDADEEALAIEATALKVSKTARVRAGITTPVSNPPHGAVACWDSQWAEHMFLMNHYRLSSALALKRIGL